jgi:hypothetical protein
MQLTGPLHLKIRPNKWRMKMKTETSLRRSAPHGSSVELRSGSEGPRHDPYAYEEVTVYRADGRVATIHLGLASWMRSIDYNGVERKFDETPEILHSKFEATVGITPTSAIKALHRAKHNKIKRHSCGQQHLNWVSGYPGEEMLCCGKCGHILDSTFDRSAIE